MSRGSLVLALSLSLAACGETDAEDTGTAGPGGSIADGGATDGGSRDGGATADGGADGGSGDGGSTTPDDDRDRDGLSNDDEESLYGTDPDLRDTDGDGQTDAAELAGGSDPLNSASVVSGIYVEVDSGSDGSGSTPLTARIVRGDIAFVLDTSAAGLDHLFPALGGAIDEIAVDLAPDIPDPTWGLGTFEDYAYGSMGSLGTDLPFHLEHQQTRSASTVATTMTGLQVRAGADAIEAGLEGLYQVLTGAGYDQGCDSAYDDDTDILPFLASATDPFGGTAGEGATSGALGSRGGLGFRDLSLPVVIYATDNAMRDPDHGDDSPGGCAADAGSDLVTAAVVDLQAQLVGVCVTSRCVDQMGTLAASTGSMTDPDGDGLHLEPAVVEWTTLDVDALRDGLLTQVHGLLDALRFDAVEGLALDDEHGFISAITVTSSASDLALGTTLAVEVELTGAVESDASDQVFVVQLQVIGDERILLGETQLVVVVPGA